MRIFSISRRTDARVILPKIASQLREGVLEGTPASDAVLVLWTKDPGCILRHLTDLCGWRWYAQITVTGYPRWIEPRVPLTNVDDFQALSEAVGKRYLIWRYDPIICAPGIDADWHRANFLRFLNHLGPYCSRVITSVLDAYSKIDGSGILAPALDNPRLVELIADMKTMCDEKGLALEACAEAKLNLPQAHCIDARLIHDLFGIDVDAKKDPTQRKDCGCCVSTDLGQYRTCPHKCLYCYAK